MRLKPLVVLGLWRAQGAAAETCADFVADGGCQEYCLAEGQTVAEASECDNGASAYRAPGAAGDWKTPSIACTAVGCTLYNFVQKCDPTAETWDAAACTWDAGAQTIDAGDTLANKGLKCCDDATYTAEVASCDVNGDGSEDYRDFLTEYKGIVAASTWHQIPGTKKDHSCRCAYTLRSWNSVFTFEELQGGAFLLYVLGVVYMFLALAIVCDEFLVPALDCIIEATGVSNDVAGATFMAAGGSAPELFTSLVGTFSQSSVGFGTIVGSAVFNVLFVIGMCALFSKETLSLTWWPLARDCSYYALSLLVLAVFFGGIAHHPDADTKLRNPDSSWVGEDGSDVAGQRFTGDPDAEVSTVHLWEAVVLFVMYIGYVLVMKANEGLRAKFDSSVNSVSPMEIDGGETGSLTELQESRPKVKANASRNGFAGFRAGMLEILIESHVVDTAAISAVHRIKGNVKDTFSQLDASKDGFIDKGEIKKLLADLGASDVEADNKDVDALLENIKEAAKNWDHDRPNEVSLGEFTDWYITSEVRIDADLEEAFNRCDSDGNGVLNRTEMEAVMRKMGNTPSAADLDAAWDGLDVDHSGDVSKKEFIDWYRASDYFDERFKLDEAGKGEDEGMSLCPIPKATGSRIMYFILFPINVTLMVTCPDVRKPHLKKYYPLSFVISITWIGLYSYMMVWWAGDVGCALTIPVRNHQHVVH